MAQDIRVALTLDNKQFNSALNKSEKEVNSFSSSSGKQLKALGAAFAALITTDVISGIIKTGSAFQDLQNSLNVVFGSVSRGADEFKRIQEFAVGTQFSVQELTKAFVQLKGAGVQPTDELLMTFADTASVVTDQLGAFQAMVDLVTRSTAGGLGLEDLNRLADRGIPVFTILEEKLGITRLEISKFGQTAAGANKVLDALTRGLNERFGGALEDSAENISRLQNNLGDATQNLQKALFDLFSEDLAAAITKTTELIEKLSGSIENLENGGESLKKMLFGLAGVILFFVNPVSGLARMFGFLSIKMRGSAEAVRQLTKNFNTFRTVALAKYNMAVGKSIKDATLFEGALKGVSSTVSLVFKRFTQLISVIAGLIGIYALFGKSNEEVTETVVDLRKEVEKFVGPPRSKEMLEAIEAAAKKLQNRIKDLSSAAKGFANNEYRTELQQMIDAQKDAEIAINDLNFAMSLSEGTLKDYELLLAAANNELAKSTKELKEYKKELADENLTEYQKYIKSLTTSMIDYAKEQENAQKALTFFNQLFEMGAITNVEAYAFIIERLNTTLGITGEATKKQVENFDQFTASVDILHNSASNYALLLEQLNGLLATNGLTAEQAAEAQAILNARMLENEGLNSFIDTLGTAQKALSDDLAQAFMDGENAGESFQKFFKKMVKQIIADIIRLSIIQPILNALLGPFGFGFGAGGSVVKLPTAAHGGRAKAGEPMMIGESGPEAFIPRTDGQIISNHRLGQGGGPVTNNNNYITNNINALDSRSVAQVFAENRQTLLGTVEYARKETSYGV